MTMSATKKKVGAVVPVADDMSSLPIDQLPFCCGALVVGEFDSAMLAERGAIFDYRTAKRSGGAPIDYKLGFSVEDLTRLQKQWLDGGHMVVATTATRQVNAIELLRQVGFKKMTEFKPRGRTSKYNLTMWYLRSDFPTRPTARAKREAAAKQKSSKQ